MGLQKKKPGRKRTQSDGVLSEMSVEKKCEDKENNPVGLTLSESFGSHSFDEDKVKRKYKRKNKKWGEPMKPKCDKNQLQREKKKMEKKKKTKEEHEQLKELLGNPMDDFDIEMTKKLVIHFYLKLWDQYEKTIDLEETVANLTGVSVSSVYRWLSEFKTTLSISESRRGKSAPVECPIDNENFREKIISYVKENARLPGQPNLTCQSLADWVNMTLEVKEVDRYSARTMYDWLHRLNFNVTVHKKKLYFDGHERPDVVKDRERFKREMDSLKSKVNVVNPITLEEVENPRATHIRVSQDEKIHHSNDTQSRFWSDGKGEAPPPKSLGQTIMTSDFLTESFGFVNLSKEELTEAKKGPYKHLFEEKTEMRSRKAGSILNVSKDGYYDHKQMIKDFEKCHHIVMMKTGLNSAFITDNSPIHNFMSEDSLDASKMNKGSGGKQPKMRDTEYEKDGVMVKQSMVFTTGPLKGEAKGLKVILAERYGDEFVQGKLLDELTEIMKNEPDFKMEKTLLEKECERRGDILIKGVKYHPELMPIESAYRNISNFMRRTNTPGSARGYESRIENSYEDCDLSLELIRKYFRTCDEFLDEYSKGATGDTLYKVMKEKKKHRGPAGMLEEEKMKNTYNRSRKFNLPSV